MMKNLKIGIVGLGVMGAGIAQATLQAGHSVHVTDVSAQLVQSGVERIRNAFEKMVEKEQLSQDEQSAILERLSYGTNLNSHANCELVIEVILENILKKKEVFQALDNICPDTTIIASNTSTIPITLLAASTNRPTRVVGLHFFNPPALMKLVEVTRTFITTSDVIERAIEYVRSINKIPVLAKDKAGFIVNKLLTPYLFDAMRAVEEGLASVEDIDNGMALGCGHPMGPLKLSDFIGLDVLSQGAETLFDEYKDTKFAAPPIMRRLVSLGFYGVKSGRGFYDWSDRKKPLPMVF
jgi:3-hydroxybutyryl-CoA dehydrogenase